MNDLTGRARFYDAMTTATRGPGTNAKAVIQIWQEDDDRWYSFQSASVPSRALPLIEWLKADLRDDKRPNLFQRLRIALRG